MAVFWNDLDDFLVDLFTTEMGTGSAYTTLKAQTVNKRVFANQNEWPYWRFPALSVASHVLRYDFDGHDSNMTRRYKRIYSCIAIGLVEGIAGEIAESIKEFYERMELVLRQGITVNSNSIITRGATIIRQGFIDEQMYTNDSTDSTKRIGVADIRFEIEAKG